MKKVILIVIDGLGLREETQGNGFKLAHTPTFDYMFANYPNSRLAASGLAVGLPEGQMGNSEVGHLTIGAGTTVYTGLSLINNEIKKGTFSQNVEFLKVFDDVKKNNSTLHLMGLLSPGGVHSHEAHLFELLKAAHANGVKKVSVHAFGDGRDVAPKSISDSFTKLQAMCDEYGYKIASIGGRFYGMDRDQNFDLVQQHYNALLGQSDVQFNDALEYVQAQYAQDKSDEFFVPAINPQAEFIKNNDSVIFFNFRPDRARQLAHLLTSSSLYEYKNTNPVKLNNFVAMMKYEGIDCPVAFKEMEITTPIGRVIEQNGLKQLRLAETQKYAHVTFFMDGGVDVEMKNSKRIMVPSLKVTYDQAPQMSAKEITDELIKNALDVDITIMNYANPDMVGHTGDLQATIKAVEFLDTQIKRVLDFANEHNITVFITADHGNAEITEDANGKPATKHTTSEVMLICNDKSIKLANGKLSNVAPTVLDYMNIAKPEVMDENSLIIK